MRVDLNKFSPVVGTFVRVSIKMFLYCTCNMNRFCMGYKAATVNLVTLQCIINKYLYCMQL